MPPVASTPIDLHPASVASDFTTLPVLINVGGENQNFYVHESLLRLSSKFFDAALNKEWQEGQSRVINLPESKPETFKVYVNWLYSGKLCVGDKPSAIPDSSIVWEGLILAYILGDKLLDVDFKDAVLNAAGLETLREKENGIQYIAGPTRRRLLYDNTMPNTPLRRLVVRRLIMFGEPTNFQEDEPSAFLYDVIQEMSRKSTPTAQDFFEELASCKYHEHEPGEENCYRNKRRYRQ